MATEITKELKAQWKAQIKLFKKKEAEKKQESMEYCRLNPLFVVSGGGFGPLMNQLAKTKVGDKTFNLAHPI